MKIISLLLAYLLFVSSSCGQIEKSKEKEFVLINTSTFYDERVGIIPLVLALKKLDSEFETQKNEVKELTEKHNKLADEIASLRSQTEARISKEIIDKKISDYEVLDCKLKSKNGEVRSAFLKRQQEATIEIKKDIEKSIKRFAEDKNYNIVIVESKDGQLFDELRDITLEFIKFYHMMPKEKNNKSMARKSILVVDDEKSQREILEMILSAEENQRKVDFSSSTIFTAPSMSPL